MNFRARNVSDLEFNHEASKTPYYWLIFMMRAIMIFNLIFIVVIMHRFICKKNFARVNHIEKCVNFATDIF